MATASPPMEHHVSVKVEIVGDSVLCVMEDSPSRDPPGPLRTGPTAILPEENQGPLKWAISNNVIQVSCDGGNLLHISKSTAVGGTRTARNPVPEQPTRERRGRQNKAPHYLFGEHRIKKVAQSDSQAPRAPSSGYFIKSGFKRSSSSGYKCTVCAKLFRYPSKLAIHQRMHMTERPFSCSECRRGFYTEADFLRHWKNHERESFYKCSLCGKGFKQRSLLSAHHRTHAGEQPYSCGECGKRFFRKCTLVQHQRRHRMVVRRSPAGARIYDCTVCKTGFPSIERLFQHQQTHAGGGEQPCNICGKYLMNVPSLIRHLRTHTGEKPYPCTECELSFADHTGLTRHRRCHKDVRQPADIIQEGALKKEPGDSEVLTPKEIHPCPSCGEVFGDKASLAKHEEDHDQATMHTCRQCWMQFKDRTLFFKHKKTHREERPYSCPECRRSFARRYALDNHLKSHKDCYICTKCGESFSVYHRLVEHQHLEKTLCGSA